MKLNNGGVFLAVVFAMAYFCIAPASARYLEDNVNYAPNKIVIALKAPYSPINPTLQGSIIVTGIKDIDELNRRYSVSLMWPLFPKAEEYGEIEMAGYYSITFQNGFDLESVLAAFDSVGSVDHVEPVGVHRLYFTPNDYYFNSQWGMARIHIQGAWDITQGSTDVPLGIADTGVDWNHPDLDDNIWINTADPVDGIDNDGNGYIDDYHGWDWVTGVNGAPGEDDNTPDNNPMDFAGHGTHVAGIASAQTNNGIGVAGVGFNCKIMALRIGWLDPSNIAYVGMDFAASAFYYAANKGAKAINASWGSSNSGGLGAATNYAVNHGLVIVSAAGNDNNQTASYLCSRSDVISVAATDQGDHKASFSNYGTWVDVSAPGVSIWSTVFDNAYAYMDGTSMAAPHVTGLVGLLRSAVPTLTRAQVQAQIVNNTDNIDALNPSYVGLLGSGRINATNAFNGLGPFFVPGDANGSGDVNGIDVVYLVNYLKGGPPPPDPILRGDANGSCSVNGIDVTYLINFLKGGPAPYAGNCR